MAWSPNPHLSPFGSGDPDDSLRMIKDDNLNYENHHTLPKKYKSSRDPTSHRIIEKRRRDRMNNCLADLSRMIPSNYMKHGQSRVEKTEIVELAIRFIINLNSQLKRVQSVLSQPLPNEKSSCCHGQFYLGFSASTNEAIRYLVESEGFSSNDSLCAKLRSHLQAVAQKHIPDLCDTSAPVEGTSGGPGPPPMNPHPLKSPSSDFSINMSTHNFPPRPNSGLGTVSLVSANSTSMSKLLETQHSTEYMPPVDDSDLMSNSVPMDTSVAQSDVDMNGMRCGSVTSSSSGRDIYKFKNDIKLRFKADMSSQTAGGQPGSLGQPNPAVVKNSPGSADVQVTSDTSSSSSRDDSGNGGSGGGPVDDGATSGEPGTGADRIPTSNGSSTGSSTYSASGETSGHGSSQSSATCLKVEKRASADRKMTERQLSRYAPPRSESLLPGFVLHLSGTHYIPIVVCPSQIDPSMTEEPGALPGIYHPISIPVNFGAARFINPAKMENPECS